MYKFKLCFVRSLLFKKQLYCKPYCTIQCFRLTTKMKKICQSPLPFFLLLKESEKLKSYKIKRWQKSYEKWWYWESIIGIFWFSVAKANLDSLFSYPSLLPVLLPVLLPILRPSSYTSSYPSSDLPPTHPPTRPPTCLPIISFIYTGYWLQWKFLVTHPQHYWQTIL